MIFLIIYNFYEIIHYPISVKIFPTTIPSLRTLTRNRVQRRLSSRGGKEDSSESDSEKSSSGGDTPFLGNRKEDPSLTSPTHGKTTASAKRPSTKPKIPSTASSKPGLRERTPSFDQADNPFYRACARPKRTSDSDKDKEPEVVEKERQPVAAASSKSLPPSESPKLKPRRSRPISEGRTTSDLKAAYLNAAKFSGSPETSSKKLEVNLETRNNQNISFLSFYSELKSSFVFVLHFD